MSNLTPKQEKFCQEYVKTGNASEAYRQSYDVKTTNINTINVKACTLLKESKISIRVQELKEQLSEKHNITKDTILKQLCDIAFLDIGKLADENGNIKDIMELDKNTRKLLQGAELKSLGSGDSATTTMAYKLSDKLKAIEMINKMLGFNEPEKVEHSGETTRIIKTIDNIYED